MDKLTPTPIRKYAAHQKPQYEAGNDCGVDSYMASAIVSAASHGPAGKA